MMIVTLLAVVGICLKLSSAQQEGCEQVNSFIATGGLAFGYGGINPGAQYPFGALRLGPDTTYYMGDLTWRHFSGYNYQDTTIRAFSHTHLVGAGVNDLGSVGVMPISASKDVKNSSSHDWWWSDFDKASETASPGFYSVFLDGPQVKAELVAISNMAAVHRYTWSNNNGEATKPALVIDMCHDSKIERGSDNRCLEGSLTVDASNPNIFTGHVHTRGGLSSDLTVYVYTELVPSHGTRATTGSSVEKWALCTQVDKHPSCEEDVLTKTAPAHLYGIASFGRSLKEQPLTVEMRIGISFISVDLAQQNLKAALSTTTNYNALASRTKQVWCDALSYFSFTTLDNDTDTLPMLHSASYRSLISPTNYTESGGLYLGVDHKVHNVVEERTSKYGVHALPQGYSGSNHQFTWFSDLSFWDTFRTLHPWLLLINEDLAMGLARSITEITTQQNAFPRWVLGSHEAGCMLGEHGMAFINELLLAGFDKDLDVQSIQKIFLQQLTTPWPLLGRTDLDRYLTEGYVCQDVSGDSAVETLTYAFDDYLLGVLSQFAGDAASAEAAFARSKNYKILWSPEEHVFCPKYADGSVKCPPDPAGLLSWQYYREGNAMHYSWFVPHDPEGLMALYDSPAAFDASLESFLSKHVAYHEKFGSAVPNPYYWAGNEHDFLAPWLFNVGPNCTRTQYWTKKLTYMHFSNTPHGIPGNDDYGSMSTWLLFGSLGIFPQAGTSRFFLGSPRVANAKITLRHWNKADSVLEIKTINNSIENTFIEKLLVNGQEWTQPWIDRSVLTGSAHVTLEFHMHSSPSSGLCPNA